MKDDRTPLQQIRDILESFGDVTLLSYGSDEGKHQFQIKPFTSNIVIPISKIGEIGRTWGSKGEYYELEVIEWTHTGLNIQVRKNK